MNHDARQSGCADAIGRLGLGALLVTNLTNVRYLTGLKASSAMVIVEASGRSTIITDGRYQEQAAAAAGSAAAVDVVVGDTKAQLASIVTKSQAWSKLGLEAEHVTWHAQRGYADALAARCELVPTSQVVESLRLVKEPDEVAAIEKAAAITDAALEQVLPLLARTPTEREFRAALDRAIIDGGADDLSFDTIVASGPNAARAHHSVEARKISRGDLVVIDCGALVDGYHSDMTRTFHIGEPSERATQMLDVAQRAHEAGVASVAPGVTGDQVDQAARQVVEQAGLGPEFMHGVGHGVGLDIHEAPLMRGSSEPLVEGQVVTVEPGVYRSGVGGVRVEDTVVVTADGCRRLTKFPKDPIVGL